MYLHLREFHADLLPNAREGLLNVLCENGTAFRRQHIESASGQHVLVDRMVGKEKWSVFKAGGERGGKGCECKKIEGKRGSKEKRERERVRLLQTLLLIEVLLASAFDSYKAVLKGDDLVQ